MQNKTQETALAVILPPEISTLANEVDETKRLSVTTSLNDVFQKTQNLLNKVSEINITSPDDIAAMKLANAIRLEAKNERLAAEKLFDAKRSDVQQQMARYKTEDALYLKAKQTMQIKYKHIEDEAERKAKFAERYELEQKELRYQERVAKLQPYNVDLTFVNLREMPDETFQAYLNQQETLRLAAIEAEKAQKEAERLRQENERLEAEKAAAEQEKARIEAEKKAESERIEAEKAKAEREKLEAERQSEMQKLKEQEEAARLEAERVRQQAEAARLEQEKARKEQEAKIKKQQEELAEIEREKQKRREFEEAEMARLAKLDDVGLLVEFKKQLEAIVYPECKNEKNKVAVAAAKDRIGKICEYLAEQIK